MRRRYCVGLGINSESIRVASQTKGEWLAPWDAGGAGDVRDGREEVALSGN